MNNVSIEPTQKGFHVQVTPGEGREFERPKEVLDFIKSLLQSDEDDDGEQEEWNHV